MTYIVVLCTYVLVQHFPKQNSQRSHSRSSLRVPPAEGRGLSQPHPPHSNVRGPRGKHGSAPPRPQQLPEAPQRFAARSRGGAGPGGGAAPLVAQSELRRAPPGPAGSAGQGRGGGEGVMPRVIFTRAAHPLRQPRRGPRRRSPPRLRRRRL